MSEENNLEWLFRGIGEAVRNTRSSLEQKTRSLESYFSNFDASQVPEYQQALDAIDNYQSALVAHFKKISTEDIEDLDPILDFMIDDIIAEMRQNWRIKHPTKYEQILEIMRGKGGKGFTLDDIEHLYGDRIQAMTALSKLNSNYFAPRGLDLSRSSIYSIRAKK